MNRRNMFQFTLAAAMALAPMMFAAAPGNPGPGQGGGPPANVKPVRVQVEWSQAQAKPGNAQPINLVVIVTDYQTGASVPNLSQGDFHFKFMESGCVGALGAQIISFNSSGNGVYAFQLAPHPVGGCGTWQAQGIENHSVEVSVYLPSSPINAVGRYGITTMHIEVL